MSQEKEPRQEQNSVYSPGGLHTDSSLVTQPQGTTRFVMTGVNETKEGDANFIANEESNEACYTLPTGYIPMGKVYIGDEETCLFLANPNGNSCIAVVDRNNTLTIKVSDANQTEKLGFKTTQQIDATFRLRRGCDKIVYWVDPKPRLYNFNKPEEFLTESGTWDISKFNLFKKYKKIPQITNITVVEAQGNLLPGSYNFSIRYLDEDFNPTEFIDSTETIQIYNSALNRNYRELRGSTTQVNDYLNYGKTGKAIKIVIDPDSLDTTFPFYQIAITEANSGNGLISDTKYTSEISTRNPVFYYTGDNYETSGTQEEVTMFNNIIEKAQSIEQIENRLILGDTEGKQVNFCNLQKYASKIGADLITKQIIVSELSLGSAKDPAAHFNGIGYMPGEIYSFGIVYIFEDNTVSPVYHIPGKGPTVAPMKTYSEGDNIYPMSNLNNACLETAYIDNNTCGENVYWGKDSEGNDLSQSPVRHHRFPLRTDVGIPFVEEVTEPEELGFVKSLQIEVTKASATIPGECEVEDTECTPSYANFGAPVDEDGDRGAYSFTLDYSQDGETSYFADVVDPYDWAGTVGDDLTQDVNFVYNTSLLYGNVITPLTIKEEFEFSSVPNENTVTLTGPTLDPITHLYYFSGTSTVTGMTYKITIAVGITATEDKVYTAEIFGINFSNIQMPSLEDTLGQKITGYYIVRNERKESDKTVLDSAILTPTSTEKNFVAQGLLFPQYISLTEENKKIKKDVLGLISPEHKFNNAEYTSFTSIIQQGSFNKTEAIISRTKVNDVADGSGYVEGKHKKGQRDPDGFSIQIKTRDNQTTFVPEKTFTYTNNMIKDVFYLNALENKLTKDSEDKGADIFNLACDNKTGILTLKQDYDFRATQSAPYVYLYKENAEPYSNFRLEPYYKASQLPTYFEEDAISSCVVFNGDSYIAPMRYTNSIYYDIRMKKRKGKKSIWKIIIGAVLVVAAVALTIFTLGATSPLVVAAGLAAAGALAGVGTAITLSGIKQEAWNNAYNILYDQGLRETVKDDYVFRDLDPVSGHPRGFEKNPEDDEIQWLGDSINLWFESAVNVGLRHGASDNTPDFLNAPGPIEAGCTLVEWNYEYFGINSVGSSEIAPTNALDFHMYNKLTFLDAKRKANRGYYGLAAAEMYLLNPDYKRRNKQKAYFHLGLEYDCCSDCNETFPHRFHWSEQAFQEEVTDNFRMFLPNNYKDLEAETGRITDIFRIQNNLYIHTTEGLWHCPQTFQERVTQDIVSFIGTGEYFSVPPRKIVDDNNSSAGNKHKWGRLKTKFGVLFPSWKEKKWYIFDGQQLQPISDNGNSSWFKNNMEFEVEKDWYQKLGSEYPYKNNPSNSLGVGFISTYDTNKERLIITKKDIKITNLPTSNFLLCNEGPSPVIFTNVSNTIANQEALGWTYLGVENCKLKFNRVVPIIETIPVNQDLLIPSDMDIHIFYDTSGSYVTTMLGQGDLYQEDIDLWYYGENDPHPLKIIDAEVDAWVNDNLTAFGWEGNVVKYYDATGEWLDFPKRIPAEERGKVLLISFVNNSVGTYHDRPLNFLSQPTGFYTSNYNSFVDNVYATYDQFIGISYPIATLDASKSFILHNLAAVKGMNYTYTEVNNIPTNAYFSSSEWSTLKTYLQGLNPYEDLLDASNEPGLSQYSWLVIPNRTMDVASEELISASYIGEDLTNIVRRNITFQDETEIIGYTTEVTYIQGTPFVPTILNNSWTMSYSLKRQEWVGWHPYLPSFYMHVQEKFYSWKQGGTSIFKHNRPNHYQTFYGIYYPFIVEYVDNPNLIATKVWDSILFQSEAKRFDNAVKDYVDIDNVTFNKVLLYNTYQISGLLELVPKQNESANYLFQQTRNLTLSAGQIPIDRNERDWTLNDMRNLRVDNIVPMFIKDLSLIQSNYYIDKIVNPAALSYSKDWAQLESFRDKFLVVRLIFDTFADTRILFNFSASDKKISER